MTDSLVDLEELNARRAEYYARLRPRLALTWTLAGGAVGYFAFPEPAPWIRVLLGGSIGLVFSLVLVWIGSRPLSAMPRPRGKLFRWFPFVGMNVVALTVMKLSGPASGGWTLPIFLLLLLNAVMFGASRVTARPSAYERQVRKRIVIYLAIGAALVVAVIAYAALQQQP